MSPIPKCDAAGKSKVKPTTSLPDADALDSVTGLLKDLSHIPMDLGDEPEKKKLPASADMNFFFDNPHTRPDPSGTAKKVFDCRLCK